jgi:hypothetical protein
MVKKKNSTVDDGATSSGVTTKVTSGAPNRGAPEVSVIVSVPGDWPASTMMKCDKNKVRSLGLISADEGNVILPGSSSRPNPPTGFTVMFISFMYRGLSLRAHEFLRLLLHLYEIQLWQLTPNSILHLAIFITLYEAFLGIEPHWVCRKRSSLSNAITVVAVPLSLVEFNSLSARRRTTSISQ